MKSLKPYSENISWLYTFGSDLAMEFTLGILIGLQTLLETGDLTQASLIALGCALGTATLRSAIKKLISFIKSK